MIFGTKYLILIRTSETSLTNKNLESWKQNTKTLRLLFFQLQTEIKAKAAKDFNRVVFSFYALVRFSVLMNCLAIESHHRMPVGTADNWYSASIRINNWQYDQIQNPRQINIVLSKWLLIWCTDLPKLLNFASALSPGSMAGRMAKIGRLQRGWAGTKKQLIFPRPSQKAWVWAPLHILISFPIYPNPKWICQQMSKSEPRVTRIFINFQFFGQKCQILLIWEHAAMPQPAVRWS